MLLTCGCSLPVPGSRASRWPGRLSRQGRPAIDVERSTSMAGRPCRLSRPGQREARDPGTGNEHPHVSSMAHLR